MKTTESKALNSKGESKMATRSEQQKRSEAAKKAWKTRNSLAYKRSQAAKKAWETRRSMAYSER